MAYVDGFVLPVPQKNIDAYRALAQLAGTVWRDHGALSYHEYIADDVKSGEINSFPQSVLLEPNEVVVFSWIVYESREHRDAVNAKVMKDPRMQDQSAYKDVFDAKRMIFGGFKNLLEL